MEREVIFSAYSKYLQSPSAWFQPRADGRATLQTSWAYMSGHLIPPNHIRAVKILGALCALCYNSLSLPPLHFISIGYTFPILFKSPFSISINKLFYFQPFYYSAFYYSAFHYSAFLLFSLILLSLFIIQLYYSATFLLV